MKLNQILTRFIASSLLAISIPGLRQISHAASLNSNPGYDWGELRIDLSGDCAAIVHFASPYFEEGACYSEVQITKKCLGEGEVPLPSKSQFVAFPNGGANKCVGFVATEDFFPQSYLGGDSYFADVLRNASRILNQELESPSETFVALSTSARDQISKTRMSSFSGMRNVTANDDGVDRYRLSFPLTASSATIVLEVNEDGSEPVWSEVVP